VIDRLTVGIGAAGSGICTWIHALLTHAGQFRRAALIGPASRYAVQAQTELSMTALIVVAAQGFANSLLASLVGQAASIVGA